MHAPAEHDYIQQFTVDCVIFGYQGRQLKVLVPKLHFNGDFWALPSGFISQDEDVDDAARRILQYRTGLEVMQLEQFQVMGKAGRSNRPFLNRILELNPEMRDEQQRRRQDYEWFTKRFISIGYYALVDLNKVVPQRSDIDESVEWFDIKALPSMILDHNDIVAKALDSLRVNLDQKLTVFSLLPETFTMKEVQELYETILGKSFARNNFPKKILELNVLERLEKKFTGAAHKAPYLYRFHKPDALGDDGITHLANANASLSISR